MSLHRMSDVKREKNLSYSRALLELTIRENGEAMSTITRIFSQIAYLFVDVEERCAELRRRAPGDETLTAVERDFRSASQALREGLCAVQLHDITDQRLSHVVRLLRALEDRMPLDIASVLTEDEERSLLELIDDGVAIDDALDRLRGGSTSPGSVELF